MALAINDKVNTDLPSARYPQGKIRDNDGTGNGTPVDTSVYGDFHQFFARLLVEAGISPNHIPENAYEGFQYIEALLKLLDDRLVPYTTTGITYQNTATAGANLGIKKTKRNTIKISGTVLITLIANFNSGSITLPAGYRPSYKQVKPIVIDQQAASSFSGAVVIDTTGIITFLDTVGLASTGFFVFHLDTLEFDL